MILGGFPEVGYLLRGPHNKDYSSLGVYIGVPLFWETTTWLRVLNILGPTFGGRGFFWGGGNTERPYNIQAPIPKPRVKGVYLEYSQMIDAHLPVNVERIPRPSLTTEGLGFRVI